MSDNAIRAVAFVLWPLIVAVFALAMFLALVAIICAWPFVPFMKVNRK